MILRKKCLHSIKTSERGNKKKVMPEFCGKQNFKGILLFELIRRSLEFFRVSRKNRDDSSFLDDEAKTIAHHGLKRSLRGFRYAQPLKMTMIICFVLSLGVVSESMAACNGATATTAGTDEENKPCGTWDCGAAGSNVTCTLSKSTLTISGEGEMRDYFYTGSGQIYPRAFKTDAPWGGKYVTKAVIDGNITKIGNSTFLGESYLTEISGTESLKTIGSWGFEYSGIKSIDIPNVTTLDLYAFFKANDLEYINMRDDIVFINTYGGNWSNLESWAFNSVNIVNSCITNPETGMKTCGSCGDKYVKAGTGCVKDCGKGYLGKEGKCIDSSLGCGNGYKDMGGFCNRVRYTPAEAAEIAKDDGNVVTITFRK